MMMLSQKMLELRLNTTFPKLPNELILWFLVMMQRINLEWLLSSLNSTKSP